MQFLKAGKSFLPRVRKSLDNLRNQKCFFFSKSYHFFKRLFWRHKLHSPLLKLSNKNRKILFWESENMQITVLWSSRLPFSQPCESLSNGGRKFLAQLQKINLRPITYSKKSSSKSSSGHIRGSFHQLAELLFRIFLMWPKNQKQSSLCFGKRIFLGLFLCTPGMQFWQNCQKTYKNPKTFHSNSENNYTNIKYSQREHLMRKRLLARRLHVWQLCRWKNRLISEKLLARKNLENKNFLRHFFHQKLQLDT